MKNLKHGTVVGEMEPQVRELFEKHARRKKRQTGFSWYSRLKLYDEALARGKFVEALTDEEFEDALYSIDRYFKMHPSYPTQWGLQAKRGPQSAADRDNEALVNYLGAPKRHYYYSWTLFQQEMWALRQDATLDTLTEVEFQDLLRRTSHDASNHSVSKNYGTPFSGPQCFTQRHDEALMQMEPGPRPATQLTGPSSSQFQWLQCDACDQQRRVDDATFRLFHNDTWNSDAFARRRRE